MSGERTPIAADPPRDAGSDDDDGACAPAEMRGKISGKTSGEAAAAKSETFRIYATFVLVGTGCGWFVADSVFQLLANVPETRQDGKMFGTLAVIGGAGGMAIAALYFASLAVPSRPSLHVEQRRVTLIIMFSVLSLAALAAFWDVGAPRYPVVITVSALGCVVANATYFILFPLVSTYYGGWLVAPVRAGTDTSTFLTTIFAEVENPSGNKNLFPPWVLFAAYAGLAFSGLVAWQCVVRFKIGLLSEQARPSAGDAEAPPIKTDAAPEKPAADGGKVAGRASEEGRAVSALQLLRSLYCPRELTVPVVLALLVEITQWGILGSVAEIGASMTDPAGCHGAAGNTIFRTAMTLNRGLLPLASVASSLAWCPRWLFDVLAGAQLVASAGICVLVMGLFREFWTSEAGQAAFTAMFAVTGALEGYVLTTAYRYIGDCPGLSQDQRRSASSLLSFLSVAVVNPVGVVVGQLVGSGVVACFDP